MSDHNETLDLDAIEARRLRALGSHGETPSQWLVLNDVPALVAEVRRLLDPVHDDATDVLSIAAGTPLDDDCGSWGTQ